MTTKSKQDKHKMSEIDENISKMFDIKKRLGKGAYGIVWKALDKRNNETIAVKKIFDAFRDETDAQRTFREIIFLKAFRSHPNVVKLHNVFRASNNLDIYLIFEYMESDLHNIIKKGSILKDIHKRYVMYQLINAVKYIHSGNVIHRDLKPSNVLIDSKCRCKLADFGLARSVAYRPVRSDSNNDIDGEIPNEPLLTDYVATRWYRAPEILVASKRYTKGIDMWSLGCILGEMIRGKPLFQGSSTVNQIEKIVSTLPEVTEHDIKAVGAGFGSVLLNKTITKEKKINLNELLIDASKDALDLVKSLLVLDPMGRLTAKQALCHPYLEKFRNSIPEKELNFDVLPPFRDDVRLTVPEYRTKLYEILNTSTGCGEPKRQTEGTIKTTTSSNIKHREHRTHDKPDVKRPMKPKPIANTSNAEEKIITTSTTEVIGTYSNRNAVHRCQTKISPLSKRKQIYNANESNNTTKVISENIKSDQIISLESGQMNRSKSNASYHSNIEKRTLPHVKRHSITNTEETVITQTRSSSNKRLTSSHRLCRSSTTLTSAEREVRSKPPQTNKNAGDGTPIAPSQPQPPLRPTKSEVHYGHSDEKTSQSKDRLCFEKRLTQLGEEIERYKNEVKTFIYSKQKYSVDTKPSNHNKGAPPTNFSTSTPIKATYFQLLTKGHHNDANKSDFDLSSGNSGSSDQYIHSESIHSFSGRSKGAANKDPHIVQRPHKQHQSSDRLSQRKQLSRPISKFT